MLSFRSAGEAPASADRMALLQPVWSRVAAPRHQ